MTGPVMGITLVLMAVFLPTAFLEVSRGSSIASSPDNCGPPSSRDQCGDPETSSVRCLSATNNETGGFRGFNSAYGQLERVYTAIVQVSVRQTAFVMVLFLGLVDITRWWFIKLPTGFVPTCEVGVMRLSPCSYPTPPTQERTRAVSPGR